MPDPRLRRVRPHWARSGRPLRAPAPGSESTAPEALEPDAAEPPELETAELLEPEAEPAAEPEPEAEAEAAEPEPEAAEPEPEAEAEAEAAEPEPEAAEPEPAAAEAATDDHLAPDEAQAAEDEAAALAAAQLETAEPEAAAEPVGWFRDEPIDVAGGERELPVQAEELLDEQPETPQIDEATSGLQGPEAEASAEEIAAGGEAEPSEPLDETIAILRRGTDEPVVRDRDRPAVTPWPSEGPPPRGSRLRGLLVGIAVIVIVGAVGFGAGLMLPSLLPGPGVEPGTPTPAVSAEATPTAAPTPSPEVTASPTATPAPTPVPTATPTPAPTPIVYVVQPGDQLGRIAERFGVTLKAIQDANNIANPNLIVPGQRLIIPVPAATPAP